MKKVLSLALASLTVASALASCAPAKARLDDAISLASSDAAECAAWLDNRLEDFPTDVIVGIGSNEAYGIDMTDFEEDGYVVRTIGNDTLVFGATAEGLDRAVRKYAKAADAGSAMELNETYHEGARIKRLTIAGRDISEYTVVIPDSADECMTFAASTLRDYIGKACGFYPPINSADSPRKIILEQITAEDERYSVLGDEGYTISLEDDGDLCITGGRYRGCMYAVYDLLEKYVGWRFVYDYDLTNKAYPTIEWEKLPFDYHYATPADAVVDHLSESDHVDIPAGLSDTHVPSYIERQQHGYGPGNTDPGNFHLKMKENGRIRQAAAYNGYGVINHACHGSATPVTIYYGGDIYSAHHEQPCFTDEGFIETAEEYFIGVLQSKLDAGQQVGREIVDIDVSQVDSEKFCICKDCNKLYKEDGYYIGAVLYYTNLMADAVAENISPDVYVNMLAYAGTCLTPKKTALRPNVGVSYCFYNDTNKWLCYNHSIDGTKCEQPYTKSKNICNVEYAEEVTAWSKLTDRLVIWYYPGTWTGYPYASCAITTIYEDFKFLSSIGVEGVFLDASYMSPVDGVIPYLCYRLMWDSDMTREEYEACVDDYYRALYGESWENIREYSLWQEHYRKDLCWSTMPWNPASDRIDFEAYSNDYRYLISLFDEALLAAETDLIEYRILHYSMHMYATVLTAKYNSMYVNGSDAERAEYLDMLKYFTESSAKTNAVMKTVQVQLAAYDPDGGHIAIALRNADVCNELFTGWWDEL